MELPPPVSEQLPPVTSPESSINHEQQTIAPLESVPAAIGSQPLPAAPLPITIPMNDVPQATSSTSSSSDDSTSLMANDGDLIEKEWVNKAKAIVERTKEDPYKQSEELTMLRADYLQKRYSKTLKQST